MTQPAWVVNRPRPGHSHVVKEVWSARELVATFTIRDLHVRYRQAALGVVWVVVQPLVAVATFAFVFRHVANVGSDGLPYAVFALVGFVSWTYFSSCVSNAANSLVGNASLLTKVYFPRIAAPFSVLFAPLVDLAVSLVLVAVLCVAYGVAPSWGLLALPLWVVWLALTALGPALWLSSANVRFRDISLLTAPLLQAWLFLSPVAYAASSLGPVTRYLYFLNPMAGPIETGRWVLVAAPWPGMPLVVSAAVGLAIALVGAEYFRRAQPTFADVI